MAYSGADIRFQRIKTLRDSKIPDLPTLKERLPRSILVGLDIESFDIKGCQNDSEIGLAVLQVSGQPPPFHPGLTQYYKENGVEALTIRLRDRGLKPQYEDPEYRYGDKVHASDEDAGHITAKVLSKYEGNMILVGFSMRAELRWIAETCPSFALHFSAYVDIQELVLQRRKQEHVPGYDADIARPGLTNTLKAMHIRDWRAQMKRHCAANDALRSLIVLSRLVAYTPMDPPPPHDLKVHAFTRIPCAKPGNSFSVRLSTQDGSKMPLYSPNTVRDLFSEYSDLKAVALNWQSTHHKTMGVKFWWVAFRTQESLDRFVLDIDGSMISDRLVCVVR